MELPDPPKAPSARSLSYMGKVKRVAPYWLSGVPNCVDVDATIEAEQMGALPTEGADGRRFYVPDFTGPGQFCVLVGWVSHAEKVEYRKSTGMMLDYRLRRLLHLQAAVQDVVAKQQALGMEYQNVAASILDLQSEINDLPLEKGMELINEKTKELARLQGQQSFLESINVSAEAGITFHDDGAISSSDYGNAKVYVTEETIDLLAFVMSRHGRVVGVTPAWFKHLQAGTSPSTVEAIREAYVLEPVSPATVAEYLSLDSLFQPIRVSESGVGGMISYTENESAETAFNDILEIAQLLNFQRELEKMVDSKVITPEDAEEIDKNPLSESAELSAGEESK